MVYELIDLLFLSVGSCCRSCFCWIAKAIFEIRSCGRSYCLNFEKISEFIYWIGWIHLALDFLVALARRSYRM
jgi:hypothetical protein